MNSRRSLIRLPLLASLYFLCATIAAGQAPEVIKVEPPGWWVGSSVNPVRLLIRGRNLRGARISSSADGIRVIEDANAIAPEVGQYPPGGRGGADPVALDRHLLGVGVDDNPVAGVA